MVCTSLQKVFYCFRRMPAVAIVVVVVATRFKSFGSQHLPLNREEKPSKKLAYIHWGVECKPLCIGTHATLNISICLRVVPPISTSCAIPPTNASENIFCRDFQHVYSNNFINLLKSAVMKDNANMEVTSMLMLMLV